MINSIDAPSYKLAKQVDKIIKRVLLVSNEFSIKNSNTFANDIVGFEMSRFHHMFSLDIVDMYSNIPTDEVISILKSKLIDSNKLSDVEVNEIINVVSAVLKQNYFQFNEEFYSMTKGIAMGGPLSSTLAELFMSWFEEEYIINVNNPFLDRIKKYHRKVDDTFFIFNGTKRAMESFYQYVNNVHPSVKFTMELSIDNILNFLDLTIKNVDNKLEVKVYRKPTYCDSLIPYRSNHPKIQKLAGIRALVNRAFNLPMNKYDFEAEIETIHLICRNNGYPNFWVNTIIKEVAKKRMRIDRTEKNSSNQKFVGLKYFNKSSEVIGRIFKNHGYTPAFKTSNNIKHCKYEI